VGNGGGEGLFPLEGGRRNATGLDGASGPLRQRLRGQSRLDEGESEAPGKRRLSLMAFQMGVTGGAQIWSPPPNAPRMSYAAFHCCEGVVTRDVTHGAFSSPLEGEGFITPRFIAVKES
jgi:hypothetical protein